MCAPEVTSILDGDLRGDTHKTPVSPVSSSLAKDGTHTLTLPDTSIPGVAIGQECMVHPSTGQSLQLVWDKDDQGQLAVQQCFLQHETLVKVCEEGHMLDRRIEDHCKKRLSIATHTFQKSHPCCFSFPVSSLCRTCKRSPPLPS